MDSNEAFVAVAAIVAGYLVLASLFRYGAKIVRDVFGTPAVGAGEDAEGASLTQGAVEDMIRRTVREEVRQEVRPLQQKIEQLERRKKKPAPRRHLPEDPHGFGLIAEESNARGEEHAA